MDEAKLDNWEAEKVWGDNGICQNKIDQETALASLSVGIWVQYKSLQWPLKNAPFLIELMELIYSNY